MWAKRGSLTGGPLHAQQDANISDQFVDIIGKVEDANTIKMYRSSNWGSNVGTYPTGVLLVPLAESNVIGPSMFPSDLDLVNKAIEEVHRLTDWFN